MPSTWPFDLFASICTTLGRSVSCLLLSPLLLLLPEVAGRSWSSGNVSLIPLFSLLPVFSDFPLTGSGGLQVSERRFSATAMRQQIQMLHCIGQRYNCNSRQPA